MMRERRWQLRAIAILLGIATTRPVMGVFFATARLTHLVPQQFFGIAFWIGFSINVLVFELWIRSVDRHRAVRIRLATPKLPHEERPMTSTNSVPRRDRQLQASRDRRSGFSPFSTSSSSTPDSSPSPCMAACPTGPAHGNRPPSLRHSSRPRSPRVLACLLLQTGAMICLGLFTAVVVSRLQFLGIRAAGVTIALFGGFLCVFDSMAAAFTTWTLIRPAVAANPQILVALNYLSYAFGGPGFSIPMGLLMAGVSITAGLSRLIPRWVMILGLFLAACGELSVFHLISPQLLFLIPLVRFPGFIWIIAVGVTLPRYRKEQPLAAAVERTDPRLKCVSEFRQVSTVVPGQHCGSLALSFRATNGSRGTCSCFFECSLRVIEII